jgi:hypothetical protein
VYRTDALLQHDLAARPAAVAQAEQHRRPDGGMAGKGQLPRRREDAQPRPVIRIGGGEDEHRLGMVELASDRLHHLRLEPSGVEHHGERVAGEAPIGEHIESDETPAHESLRLAYCWSMIFSENRCPLFGIML